MFSHLFSHVRVLLIIGQRGFWASLSVLSREERIAECKEGDLVKRDLFSLLYWVSAKVRPSGHFFHCSLINVQGCRAEMAEWPSSFVFMC